ncbi:MAG: hypothetical protein HY710_04030, partial [Candidatus Latescibacteria bacterium]|nr:hypothetical protein [Candidatus Latescibacterota bacterium]
SAMWHLENQNTVAAEYHLPEDLILNLEKASIVFGMRDDEIVMQALKEFFEKHGIRQRRIS